MGTKLLYEIGNLYTGYPWGVEVELEFGSTELHGPFNHETAASNYAHKLVEARKAEWPRRVVAATVVKIETPQAGKRIVRAKDGKGVNDSGFEYAA